MNIGWVRRCCLAFPHTTEQVQWGCHLVFKIAKKRMYAIVATEPGPTWLTVKSTEEEFAELTERPGIIPAPYMARAKWISLETEDALSRAETAQLLRRSYDLVFAKLPKKTQAALAARAKRAAGKPTPTM